MTAPILPYLKVKGCGLPSFERISALSITLRDLAVISACVHEDRAAYSARDP